MAPTKDTFARALEGLVRKFDSDRDTYLSPGQARTAPYGIEGLPPGNHSLTIEVSGTRNENSGGAWVWLDAFDVMQTTTIQPQTPVFSINITAFIPPSQAPQHSPTPTPSLETGIVMKCGSSDRRR